MTTLELKTRLTFNQLLHSLGQLTAAELDQLAVHTNRLRSQKHKNGADVDPLLAHWEQMDTTNWTEPQLAAYRRIITTLKLPPEKRGRQLGLCDGLIDIADDFDAPLPRDIEDLFWGSETDQFGMMLTAEQPKTIDA